MDTSFKAKFKDLSIENGVKILFLGQKILIKCVIEHFSPSYYNQGFSPNMSMNGK